MIKNLKPIILAILLLLGIGHVSAQTPSSSPLSTPFVGTWNNAPANPPGSNVPAPINATIFAQTKTGDLTILPSGTLNATNLVANNFTFDPAGDNPSARPGKLLTALDGNGKVGWLPANILQSVTKIIAGTGITISPCTGNPCEASGDVTISSQGMRPVTVGKINVSSTALIPSYFKLIKFSGQHTAGGSGDAGPAGGYVVKLPDGTVRWSIFAGQANMKSGSSANGADIKDTLANLINIELKNGEVIIGTSSTIKLTFVVFQ